MVEHVAEQPGLPAPEDGLWVDPAVAGLQLLNAIELFYEFAGHGGEYRELALQEVRRLARDEGLEHAGGHHMVAAPLRGDGAGARREEHLVAIERAVVDPN